MSIGGRIRAGLGVGASAPGERTFYIDDEIAEQVEVLPAAAAAWCAGQLAAAAAFARDHRSESGWTDVYVRHAAPRTIVDLGIAFDTAVSTLSKALPRFDAVLTGNPNHPVVVPRVSGFGPSPLTGVVLYPDRERQVDRIEIGLRGDDDEARQMLAALDSIAANALMIVDWRRGTTCALADAAAVEAFLRLSS